MPRWFGVGHWFATGYDQNGIYIQNSSGWTPATSLRPVYSQRSAVHIDGAPAGWPCVSASTCPDGLPPNWIWNADNGDYDEQGHQCVMSIGGHTYLYTLDRAVNHIDSDDL